jgi:hypothetical protein
MPRTDNPERRTLKGIEQSIELGARQAKDSVYGMLKQARHDSFAAGLS